MSPYKLTDEKMKLIATNWQLLADKYNGKFRNILATSPASIDAVNNKIRRFELYIPMLGEDMIFRTSEIHHFKLNYKFNKILDFELQVHPEDFVEKIMKYFGMKEFEIGSPDFDKKYIIKSTDYDYANKLLDKTVQDFMIRFNFYSFQLTTDEISQLMIMPYIKEQDIIELEAFIIFSGYLIKRIREINDI